MSMPDEAPTGPPFPPPPQPGEHRPKGLRPIIPRPHLIPGSTPPGTLSTGLLPFIAPTPPGVPQTPVTHDPATPSTPADPAVPAALPAARPVDERRSTHAVKLFSVLLFIMLASFAAFSMALYAFFEQTIEPRLGSGFTPAVREPQPRPPDSLPNELKAELAATSSRLAATASEVAGITTQLASAKNQINRLQAQIDALQSQQNLADSHLKKIEKRPLEAPAAPPVAPPASPANTSPDGLSFMQELRLLKERNRLTLYADQALANASSQAMANLWRTVRDPELAFVKDGAVAEIVRVQHFYGLMPGLPPSYHLPVRDLFHDDAIHSETELKDDQLIKLMLDQAQPLEVRTRAATLLSGHRDNKVGGALVEAMRHDPNLNVVKAAQHILQENYELYAPRLFDAISMETAWNERLAKSTPPSKAQVRPPKE